MTEAKHTLGPWVAHGTVIKVGMERESQAIADTWGFTGYVDIDSYNARLIAAAPDLLEAVRLLVKRHGGLVGLESEAVQVGLAAIAKAAGTAVEA